MDNRSVPEVKTFDLLAGGGEMGARIRDFDWTRTSLGAPESWPASLVTQLRLALSSKFPMFLWWGHELIKFYNDAYIPVLGRRHPQALGRKAADVWHEIWHILGPQVEAVLHSGEATWNERVLLPMERNGYLEETYFTFSYSPAFDDAGRVQGVFCACVEETDKALNERHLLVLRELGTVKTGGTVEDACAAAFHILSRYPADLPFVALYEVDRTGASRLTEAFPPQLKEMAPNAAAWPYQDALEKGVPARVEDVKDRIGTIQSGPWKEGVSSALLLPIDVGAQHSSRSFLVVGISAWRPLDASYQGFLELVGRQLGTVMANARAYEAERSRVEALAELDRAKTAFFSNVSHEFRTPLTLLLGPLEEALQKPNDGLSGEALDSAHRNALRLLRLVNTLLDFSRIEAGRAQAHFVSTDLAAVTEELASVFRSAMERAGLRYSVSCNSLPAPVFIDREMWEKIVLNLLSNAFKYTFDGEIRVEVQASEAGAELVVADTGTGIPPEALPQLFNRFYRVPGANGRTHEGSGIGLSLVRELVKLHGGSIDVASTVGHGSIFRVLIPFGAAHLPNAQVTEAGTAPSTGSGAQAFVAEAQRWLPEFANIEQSGTFLSLARSEPPSTTDDTSNKPIILLVDDNRDMREYVTRLLKSRFTVICAEDGQYALESIDAGARPDLVLSDVMMPRLDGFGLLKALRARPFTETTPVIFLSARAGEEARIEGFDVGADDYLIKPFSARELITRIDTHIRLSRLRRAAELALREADQRKDVFLATLAHELRNPLAPIRNAAQMLGSPKLGPEQLKWAQSVIQRQVKHMAWLLDDLLDIARITQGKLELKREHITLNSVVDSAIEAVRPLLDSKSHQFTVTLPSQPVTLDADPLRLSQVLSNLLTNAAKYTDAGGHITLSGQIETGILYLSIKDNGIGIAQESLIGIFVMFSQVESAAARSEGGLGIGLALVNGITELHGGTIEAKSDGVGHGSEFILKLPIVTTDTVVPLVPDAVHPAPIGRRLLVADDNEDAADSLAMILEMGGHDVRVVHDGRAALSVAQTFRPDAVLLDIGMPQLNGYEVARALRQEPWGAGITLIALTGWGQESDRQRAIDAGFDRHLTKPVDPDALEALLSEGGYRG